MKDTTMNKLSHFFHSIVFSSFILLLVACSVDDDLSIYGQLRFESSSEAVESLIKAVKNNQNDMIINTMGLEHKQFFETSDKAGEQVRRQFFYKLVTEEGYKLEAKSTGEVLLLIGTHAWPFPIPLVEGDGGWYFDTAVGIDEIINRRIGMNELGAITTLKALVDAQIDYASLDFDGDGVLEYAQHFRSNPDLLDGLYWDDSNSEFKSPLSSFVTDANEYLNDGKGSNSPFKGYLFKILTSQGDNTSGGAYDYIVGDDMVAGFAILAYPAEYASTGVMSFMVNHEGIIYEQDLGENTQENGSMKSNYNLDDKWQAFEDSYAE